MSLDVGGSGVVVLLGSNGAARPRSCALYAGRRIFAGLTVEENLDAGALTVRSLPGVDKSVLAGVEPLRDFF